MLNIIGLTSPIKRHKLAGWIIKERYAAYKKHISCIKTNRVKAKGWKKISWTWKSKGWSHNTATGQNKTLRHKW